MGNDRGVAKRQTKPIEAGLVTADNRGTARHRNFECGRRRAALEERGKNGGSALLPGARVFAEIKGKADGGS